MKLGIDVDGVLADFNTDYGDLFIKTTGSDLFPVGWKDAVRAKTYPNTWNWELDAGYNKAQSKAVWTEIFTSTKFWKSLEPLDGAVEAIKQLNLLSRDGHDVYFLTHRAGKKVKQQTEEWLYDKGMNYPTVLLTGNKFPVIMNLGIEFFVDDKLETMNDVFRNHQGLVKHLYVINCPWNNIGRERGLEAAHSIEDALRQAELWRDEKRGRPRK